MDVKGRSIAVDACENILREDFKYNEEHGIWRSINRIIEGLLGRSTELADVYVELHVALAKQPQALKSFFDVFTTAVYSWSPGKIKEAREDRDKLTELNVRIEKFQSCSRNFSRSALGLKRCLVLVVILTTILWMLLKMLPRIMSFSGLT